MATIKVSEMTSATTFENDDYAMIVQSNKNKKITKENMFSSIENSKQDNLVSGTNIKTINSESILGSGDLNTYNIVSTASLEGNIKIGKIGIEWGIVPLTISSTYVTTSVQFANTYKYAPLGIASSGVGTTAIADVGTHSITTTGMSVYVSVSTTSNNSRNCRYFVIGELAEESEEE